MIPTEYELYGQKYIVKLIPADQWQDPENWGEFDPEVNEIRIKDRGQASEWTFYHELVHSILMAMRHKLNNDENFVDTVAGLLHQAMKTARFL